MINCPQLSQFSNPKHKSISINVFELYFLQQWTRTKCNDFSFPFNFKKICCSHTLFCNKASNYIDQYIILNNGILKFTASVLLSSEGFISQYTPQGVYKLIVNEINEGIISIMIVKMIHCPCWDSCSLGYSTNSTVTLSLINQCFSAKIFETFLLQNGLNQETEI